VIASVTFLGVSLGLLIAAVVQQWSGFADAMERITIPSLMAALAAGAVIQVAALMGFRECLAAVGYRLPLLPVGRVFLVAALGKYIPGAVWPVVAQMEMMRRRSVPRFTSVVASILAMTIGFGATVVVGVVGIMTAGGSIAAYWWLIPIAGCCFAILWSPTLQWLLRTVVRFGSRHRELETVSVSSASLVRASGWSLLVALAYGLQAWVILRSVAAGASDHVMLAMGAAPLAFAVGFVIVFAPGGIGPREAVLIAFLGPVAGGTGGALAVAVAARLVQIAVDAFGAVVAFVSLRDQGDVMPPRQASGSHTGTQG
jgi:uncharacterized membrane protein YbhN (UPF0104 family)